MWTQWTQNHLDDAADAMEIIKDWTWTTAQLAEFALTWKDLDGERDLWELIAIDGPDEARGYYEYIGEEDENRLRAEAAEVLAIGRWTPLEIFAEFNMRERRSGAERLFGEVVFWAWVCITGYQHTSSTETGVTYADTLFAYADQTGEPYGDLNRRAESAARRYVSEALVPGFVPRRAA